MKKIKNKVLSLIPIATTAVAIPSAVGVSSNEKIDKTNEVKQSASRSSNLSLDEMTKSYLSQAGTVTQRTFYGDVNKASSQNEFNTINLDLLKDASTGQVDRAYKTLTDSYTTNIDEAKKSYLQNPVVKWSDRNGNVFDSEYEAKEAMLYNSDAFTNPVAYYEVSDYSRLDQLNNPKVVKINPFNATDLDALKEIAIKNMYNSRSNFRIERNVATNDQYSVSNFTGKTTAEINSSVSVITSYITKLIKENMWINVDVRPRPDREYVPLSYDAGYGVATQNVRMIFEKQEYADNKSMGADYNTIINDSEYFTSKDRFKQIYNIGYNKFGTFSWSPIAEAWIKPNVTVFGGQRFSVLLKDQDKIASKYKYGLSNYSIDFLGAGSKVNAYFDLGFNQNQYDSKLKADSNFFSQRSQRAEYVKGQVQGYVKSELQKIGYSASEATTLSNEIADETKNVMLQNIIGNSNVSVSGVKSKVQTKAALDKLDSIILDKINSNLQAKGKATLTQSLVNKLAAKHQTQEQANNNNVIYTITYNGQPLFKIDSTIFGTLYSTEKFKHAPQDAVNEYFKQQLNTNHDTFVRSLKARLTNVSNSAISNNGNFTRLTKTAVDNYSTNYKQNTFRLVAANNNNGFDPSIQKLDESVYASQNINKTALEKSLNRRESDDKGYLNNDFGTYEAMYQYNKMLEKALSNTNASTALKESVKNNAIKNTNDIVVLFDKDKTPATIKYGEYLHYGHKFNEALSNDQVNVVGSIEKRSYEIGIEGLNIPSKQYTYFDYDGNVLLSGVVDQINGSYEVAAQQLYDNALNKIVVPASTDYIFYTDINNNKELIENKISNLYVLKISSNSELRAGIDRYYGFRRYDDLYNYTRNYIALTSGGSNNTITTGDNSSQILAGILTAIAVITISEVAFFITAYAVQNRHNYQAGKKFNALMQKMENKKIDRQINKNNRIETKESPNLNLNYKLKLK